MNIKSVFRLSLILALASMPLIGFAQEEGEAPAAAIGEPGPWIFTFFGTEYVAPSFDAAAGDTE